MTERTYKVRTPLYPTHTEVKQFVRLIDGIAKAAVQGMISAIWEQTGTPQNPVDWTEPDVWIAERLSGEDEQLARRLWDGSNKILNPRHVSGAYYFVNLHALLVPDDAGIYRLTERGAAFLNDDPTTVRQIDDTEGIPQLLGILSTKTNAKRVDLLTEWGSFLHEHSKFGTSSTIKETLRRRLLDLHEREYITRDGNAYTITDKGLAYADAFTIVDDDPKRKVMQAINAFNEKQREALRDQLEKMHPYRFEHLVRELLEAMGYEDVTVTKESGDRGVDVLATVQFGITTIREVIQVKRHQGAIGRPILDQLRGALPYHNAIRGTIITIGNFSKGCVDAALFQGAAPIGLINGDKLIGLLIEHEVGIVKRPASLYELDTDFLQAPVPGTAVVEAVFDEQLIDTVV